MSVQRYSYECADDIVGHPEGAFVYYEDYAALQSALAAREAEVAGLRRELTRVSVDEQRATIRAEAAEAERDALRAGMERLGDSLSRYDEYDGEWLRGQLVAICHQATTLTPTTTGRLNIPFPEFPAEPVPPRNDFAPPTRPGVAVMESWHSAVDSARELQANAPDERYERRAVAVLNWILAHRPTPATGGDSDG